MNTKKIILVSLVIGTLAASAPTAWAYGTCGDGVLERPPKPNSSLPLYQEQCDNGPDSNEFDNKGKTGCSAIHAISGCKIWQNFAGNGIIEKYVINGQEQWEQCDNGHHDNGGLCDDKGMIEGAKYYNKEEVLSQLESLDSNNPSKYEKDLKALLESSKNKQYLCGNGVIDYGETCDNGFNNSVLMNVSHSAGACTVSANCQDPIANSYSDQGYKCGNIKLCGNGFVDYGAGEQCDDGLNNGSSSSECSSACTLKRSNPTFALDKVYFKKLGSATGVMDGNMSGNGVVSVPGSIGSLPIDPIKDRTSYQPNNAFHLYDRGRVVVVDRAPGQQYSGIADSQQDISEGVHVHFVLRPQSDNYPWDNDTIGLVFGIHGDVLNTSSKYLMFKWRSSSMSNSGDFTYLKGPADTCNKPSFAGGTNDRGARLYYINGSPSYNELWNMTNCSNGSSITHIPTQIYQEPNVYAKTNPVDKAWMAKYAYLPLFGNQDFIDTYGSHSWNKMVNPAFTWNTTYLDDLYIVSPAQDNVVQVDAYFNIDEKGKPVKGLKIYINYQKVIDVDGDALEKSNGGITWPSSGTWGFYFLGMDNFVADFRSLEERFLDKISIPNIPDDNSLGTRCGYCGDGITQKRNSTANGDEQCDDGNTISGDGCEPAEPELTSCHYTKGWKCNNKLEPSVCYTGAITEPENGSFVPTTPNISGTYDGKPNIITVSLKGPSGTCILNPLSGPSLSGGVWSFSSADINSQCHSLLNSGKLKDGAYTITFEINNNAKGGNDAYTIQSKFVVDSQPPKFKVTEPSPNETVNYAKSISKLSDISLSYSCDSGSGTKLSGSLTAFSGPGGNSSHHPLDFSSSFKCSGTEKSISVDHFSDSYVLPSDPRKKDYQGQYEFDVTMARGSVSNTKIINYIVDSLAPGIKEITDESGKITVAHNGVLRAYNGKLTIKGKINVACTTAKASICPTNSNIVAPVEVTVVLDVDGEKQSVTVPVVVNGTNVEGDFAATIELTPAMKRKLELGISANIGVKATDKAGNETEQSNYASGLTIIDSDAKPSITIRPQNGTSVVPSANGKATVRVYFNPKLLSPSNIKSCVKTSSNLSDSLNCNPNTHNDSKCSSHYYADKGYCEFQVDASGTGNYKVFVSVEGDYHGIVNPNPKASSSFIVDSRNISHDPVKPIVTVVGEDPDGKLHLDGNPVKVQVEYANSKDGDIAHAYVNGIDIGTCDLTSSVHSCEVDYDPTSNAHTVPTAILGDSAIVFGKVVAPNDTSSESAPKTIKIVPEITIVSPKDNSTVPSGAGIGVKLTNETCKASSGCSPVVWYCQVGATAECPYSSTNNVPVNGDKATIKDSSLSPNNDYSIVAGAKFANGKVIPRSRILVTYGNERLPDCSDPITIGNDCIIKSSAPKTIHFKGPENAPVVITATPTDGTDTKVICEEQSPCSLNSDGEISKELPNGNPPFIIHSDVLPGCAVGSSCKVSSSNPLKVIIYGKPGDKIWVKVKDKDDNSKDVCEKSNPCVIGDDGKYEKDVDTTGLNAPFSIESGKIDGSDPSTNHNDPNSGNGSTITCTIDPKDKGITTCSDNVVDGDFPLTIKVTAANPDTPYTVTITDKSGKQQAIVCNGMNEDAKKSNDCRTGDADTGFTKNVKTKPNGLGAGPYKVTVTQTPTCNLEKTLQTCPATPKDGKVVVNVNGSPGAKVNVTIVGDGGKSVNVCNGPCTVEDDGKYNKGVSVEGLTGPYEVHVTPVDLAPDSNSSGLISGGCACSSTASPTDSILSVLLAALGLLTLRRRKKDEDDDLAA